MNQSAPPAVRYVVAVPLFQAVPHLDSLIAGIQMQTQAPESLILIDSSPDDATALALRRRDLPVERIPSSWFDHGATRNLALERAAALGVPLVVFLTQDVILKNPTTLNELLKPFEDPVVAAVFGRQLPRVGASVLEQANRGVRYPEKGYVANELDGNRRFFFSNAFSAYRIGALAAVGGFPAPAIFGEDAIASARLQRAGHLVVYRPEATALHSHPAKLVTEFKRFFDVGVASRAANALDGWSSRRRGAASTVEELRRAYALGGVGAVFGGVAVAAVRAVGLTLGRVPWLPITIGRRLAYSKAAYVRVTAGSASRERTD